MTQQIEYMLPEKDVSGLGWWIFTAGAALTVLGLVIMAGWYSHNSSLIQLHPALVPMQYNTALGFLLSGLMLMAHARHLRVPEIVLGGTVAAIGMLTLLEYVTAVDLGIDQLLMKHQIMVQTSHAGRMAPNTALAFSITGIAFVLSAGPMHRQAAQISRYLGSLVFGLALAALIGYCLELEVAYGWGRLTRMAIHTASGFIILGATLFVCAWRVDSAAQGKIQHWLPIPVAILVLAITFAFWQALNPDRDFAAIKNTFNYVLFFGAVLAAVTAKALQKAASESAARQQLEVEIADRIEAVEALHQYKHIVSSTSDMLALLDRDHVYLAVNQAYLDAFDKTAQEVIGRTPDVLFGKEHFNKVIKPNAARCLGGENFHSRNWVEFPIIGRKYLEILYSPYRGADNEILGFVVTGRDITKRKQIKEALNYYKHIVASTTDQQALLDRSYVFKAVNKAYVKSFDTTIDETIGRAAVDIVGTEFFETILGPRGERCMAGERFNIQSWITYPNGELRYIDAAFSPHRGPGNDILGFVITARDITEREELQQQLVQAQKMESVGQLAGGLAHDFNNMLGVILGNAEIAMEDLDSSQPVHAALTQIQEAAKHSAGLIQQLLGFASKQAIIPILLDLNKTMDGMFEMLRRLIGTEIDLNWKPGLALWAVKMDPSQLDQVLVNLCINARDAIDGVGKISITTCNTTLDDDYCATRHGFVAGDYVLLCVSDDGCGMDAETLARIYEPFFTTKDMAEASGLGLAMVYGIVRQNDGFIHVSSAEGQQTSFEIYLPRQLGTVSQNRSVTGTNPGSVAGATILVVEDEQAVLKLIVKMLERLGYTILTASTAGDAMRLVAASTDAIDLLLTDVIMPDVNGRDLAQNLSRMIPDLKHLFMSGYTADVIADKGVLNVGLNFIQKPFSQKNLAAKVQAALTDKK